MSAISLCGSMDSSTYHDVEKMNLENWENFVNDQIYENLRMKKLAMRNTLVELTVLRSDLNCICHKINTLRSEHKAEVFCLEGKKTILRRNDILSDEDKIKYIDEVITELTNKNAEFEKQISDFQSELNDKNSLAKIRKAFYFRTKSDFNELYLLTVKDLTDLKTFVNCNVKVKIDERIIFLKHFADKVMRELENEEIKFKKYFEFIDSLCVDKEDGVLKPCQFAPSDEKIDCGKSIYDLRSELQRKREETIAYIKDHLGCALIQGFAGIKVYKPADPINYLANYLLHFKRNLILSQSHVDSLQNLAKSQQMLFEKAHENLDYKFFCQGP